MNGRGAEIMTQRVHRQQRSVAGRVTKIIHELTLRQLRTGCRFHRYRANVLPVHQVMTQKGEGNPCEVGATSQRSDHHIGEITCDLQLLFCLLTDDGLMHQHMVQYRSQRVFCRGILCRHLYRFGDRDAQTAR